MAQAVRLYEGVKSVLNRNSLVRECSITLNNGVKMPILGLGTYKIQGDELVFDVIDNALKAGYRSIDSAAGYGNEKSIGAALKVLLPKYNLRREDVFITSKLAPRDSGAEKVMKAVEDSLACLNVDYIDLYLIHWPGAANTLVDSKENQRLRRESWEGLETFYKEGKLKAIGVSNYTYRHLSELLSHSSVVPALNQVEFHPYFRQSDELLELCGKHNILLQAYCSFGGTGVTDLLDDKVIASVSKKLGVKPSQVLLRWALQSGYGIIPKTVNGNRMEENTMLDFNIPEEDMNLINGITHRNKFAWDPESVF